jgi:hypothetical protein
MKTQKATFRGLALPPPSASNSGPFQCKTSTLDPDNGKNNSLKMLVFSSPLMWFVSRKCLVKFLMCLFEMFMLITATTKSKVCTFFGRSDSDIMILNLVLVTDLCLCSSLLCCQMFKRFHV